LRYGCTCNPCNTRPGERPCLLCDVQMQASSAYSAGPHHAMFSLSLSSIYKQDVLSSGTDFLRVDGVPVSCYHSCVAHTLHYYAGSPLLLAP
jgi:hypothetical protein